MKNPEANKLGASQQPSMKNPEANMPGASQQPFTKKPEAAVPISSEPTPFRAATSSSNDQHGATDMLQTYL
jgi:hypothetical protein